MKQELPLAVALLATGCFLCFSQLAGPANSNPDLSVVSNQATDSLASTAADSVVEAQIPLESLQESPHESASPHYEQPFPIGNSNTVVQASYLQEKEPKDKQEVKPPVSPNADPPLAIPPSPLRPYIHASSNPQAVEFLAELSEQVSNSQPLGSSLKLTAHLFDQVVSATGSYYQMGQGSLKSRIELNFGNSPTSHSVVQLCDGRFVYKLQSSGDRQSLEFVDLFRLRESDGKRGGGISPTGWIATGGIASLFQHLASAFNFGEIEKVNQTTVALRGSWDENAMSQIVGVTIEENDPSSKKWGEHWNQVPAQLPHAIELVFQIDENQNYFPTQIKFLKFAASKRERILEPMVTLEFSPPQTLASISDRFFVIDSTGLDSIDVTEQYIARMDAFNRVQQTAKANATLDR